MLMCLFMLIALLTTRDLSSLVFILCLSLWKAICPCSKTCWGLTSLYKDIENDEFLIAFWWHMIRSWKELVGSHSIGIISTCLNCYKVLFPICLASFFMCFPDLQWHSQKTLIKILEPHWLNFVANMLMNQRNVFSL